MEHEAIERLAMDSAAGQLNEDTEALLREYLAEHPEANKWADDMSGIYQKIDTAIAEKTKHAVGTDTSIADSGTKPHSIVYWPSIARWAAVIALAACLGIGIGRWTKSPVLTERQILVTGYPDSTENRSSEDTGESFWRNKALAMFEAKPSIVREVPMTGPTLWEKYRQFIKERYYE